MCGPTVVNEEQKDLIAARNSRFQEVSTSPFGSDDQIGMLNLINPESMRAVLANVDPRKIYDMSTDLFTNMPSWTMTGDLSFQIWLSHTPQGTVNDDITGLGKEKNEIVSYSGDSIALYTHTGTHVDTLNHYGYHNKIWNNFSADEHIGRVWDVCGADKHPPVIARGILLDIPATQNVDMLPDSYGVGEQDLRNALQRQGTELRVGDVVLVRTGRMTTWPNNDAYLYNSPGLNREGAEFLAKAGAITIGADNVGLEQQPAPVGEIWPPVHSYLLAEAGVPMIEVLDLEELARDRVYEFAYVGACLKLRGATGAPVRPLAIPLAA
ncbi:MAG TPA: cyclase family protein [Jatrophihabitans sp.]|nr:cyclase family protein [Jatrophihabitans sp.]